MNKYVIAIVLAVIFLNSATSCKTGKKPTRKNVTVDTTAVTTPLKDTIPVTAIPAISDEEKQLINTLTPLWQQQIAFTTFNGKAKMHYDGQDMSQDFTANFKIKKDSIIWIAISASILQLQVARIAITPDSIFFINYLKKEVTLLPFSEAAKILPVTFNFSMLQNFIIGNSLRTSGVIANATDFGGSWSIRVNDSSFIQQITYNKADSNKRSVQLRTVADTGTQAIIQFGNYINIEHQKLSTSRVINVQNAGQQYYLDMDFTKVELNQPLDFPFSIPKGYTLK